MACNGKTINYNKITILKRTNNLVLLLKPSTSAIEFTYIFQMTGYPLLGIGIVLAAAAVLLLLDVVHQLKGKRSSACIPLH